MLTHQTFLKVYFALATLLALVLLCLCFVELKTQQAVWDKQLQVLSFKQHSEWQRKQAEMGRDLLVLAQPLLLDQTLLHLIKDIYQEQRQDPLSAAQHKQSHQDQLYAAFSPHWQILREQNISELSLHFASGFSLVQMENPAILSDRLGPSRPELTDVFNSGKTAHLFAVSRQGTAYRLLIPLFNANGKTVDAVIELANRLEHKSSAAALLHKQLVDMLLWDHLRKQMHPTLVGNWRLEETFEPVASWWKQGLVIGNTSSSTARRSTTG